MSQYPQRQQRQDQLPQHSQTLAQMAQLTQIGPSIQNQQRQKEQTAFSIPCAQPTNPGLPDSRVAGGSGRGLEESSGEDFSIGGQNLQMRRGSQPADSDQLQLQQQASKQMENNMQHGPSEDDNFDELNPEGLIGVIKIKDGLFICDELGAQDLEFVVANKVTRVINCAGTQLRNFWEAIGVMYLTLNWQDDEKQTLFDAAEKIPEEIYRFMEEAVDNYESVMIQSVRAQNRACFVIATFMMRRYRWSLLKTLEFLNSRRPDLEMRPSFLAQLQQYEVRLYNKGIGPKTKRWNELADSNVPTLENDELILRNTYMNSQQGPLVDLSAPPGALPKQDKLKWKDVAANQHNALCEENKDEEDLINLENPPKQLNHYNKHASHLKSKLKTSKLHAAQKRQDQFGSAYLRNSQQEPIQNQQVPPRANSANSKSKFLTKTQQVTGSNGTAQNARPGSEQLPSRTATTNLNKQGSSQYGQPPTQQTSTNHANSGFERNHQPSTSHAPQSNLFYPQPSFQQQKHATLQQKVLGQRPMSHQVRDVSPLNTSSNLNSRQSKGTTANAQNNSGNQSRGGTQGGTQSGYVPYEPKKREMTQKIAPKMPMPMSQDLTNLPLPHTHVGDKQSNQNLKPQQQTQGNSKMLDRPKGNQIGHNGTSQGHAHHPSGHASKSSSMNSGSQRMVASQQATRGMSPSFQAKTGDLGVRNRGTVSSSYKRTAMTAHPPSSSGGDATNDQSNGNSLRPGSAPKMRTYTPNGDSQVNHSLVLRSQASTHSTAGGLNSSMSLSKQMEGTNATSSKNMLNSFRNGPIKVMGGTSHMSSGVGIAHKPKVSSSKFVSSSSTSVGGRPASAPNKRPPSPSTTTNTNGHSSTANSTQNRVKYNKNTVGSGLYGHKGGVSGTGTGGAGQGVNQLKNGLNPMLRGYSPSKHRWKIAGQNNSGLNSSKTTGQGSMNSSNLGGTNPNVYTRSTKHTPSHTAKV